MAPPAAKPSDLHWEEDLSDDDDFRGIIIPDTWEFPSRPVLRNVLRRLHPRARARSNPDFDGTSFVPKPWLALAADGDKVVAEPQRVMPALLLPDEMAIDPASRCFLSLADGYLHDIAFPCAARGGARCVGSSRGWLVMLRKGPEGVAGAAGTATIHVVHPLLPRLEFRLPDEFSLFEIQVDADEEEHLVRHPLSKEARIRAGIPVEETDAEMLQRVYMPDKEGYPYITMVALSCSPAAGDDCVALCIYRRGRCLAVARPGDASWTRVEVGWEYIEASEYKYDRKFVSVVHLNGAFYAACYDGTVLRVCIPPPASASGGSASSSPPRAEKFADKPYRENWSICRSRWWLAADGDALVFVGTESCLSTSWDDERYLSTFRWDGERRFWRRTKCFGGRALFLGGAVGTAFFADARILPWCAGDCIYLTNGDSVRVGEKVTVRCYHMRSRKLYFVYDAGRKVALDPHVWVMPFHD